MAEAVFVPSGEYWTVGYRDRTFSFKASKGLAYIHRLLQHPGEEFHSLDLLRGADPVFVSNSASPEYASSDSMPIGGLGDSAGIGRRDRRAGAAAERARLNVSRAIRAALQKIAEYDAGFGKWLDDAIRTGSFCSYLGDSTARVRWKFSIDDRLPELKRADSAPPPLKPQPSLLQVKTDRTRLVGRDAELGKLCEYLDLACAGRGSIAMIAGAPGIGKTRLAGEIGTEASRRGLLTLAGACYDRDDSVPFIPFVEILESAQAQAPSEEDFRRMIGNGAGELSRLIPLLRRNPGDAPALGDVSPEQSRRLLLTAFVDFLSRTAGNGPVLLVIDDLQWGDEGTFSLLSHIARFVSEIPILLVGTYRDSEFAQSSGLAAALYACTRLNVLKQINLPNLSESATAEMTAALCQREPPREIRDLFYSGSEGNPFFVEELFRHLTERGNLFDSNGQFQRGMKLERLDVPRNVRMIIDRRLARLGVEPRKMLDTAAVIGRAFTFDLLEAATEIDTDKLLDFVEEAEELGLISSTFEYPQARFQFSHDLIRQSVLADLLVPRRQRLHLRIANTIERLDSQAPDARINDLAYHMWQAGSAAEPAKTIGYLRSAVQRAREQSANDTALAHLRNAFELLGQMPDTRERAQLELELSIEFLQVLSITNRWTTSEAGTRYARARELCESLGQSQRMYRLLQGSAVFHLGRAELDLTAEYAHRILELSASSSKPEWAASANYLLGHALCCRGDFSEAHSRLTEAVRLRNAMPASASAGKGAKIDALGIDGIALWMLGYPDQAVSSAEEGVRAAQESGNPYDLAFALINLHIVVQFRREFAKASEIAERALRIIEEKKFEWLRTSIVWSLYACQTLGAERTEIDQVKEGFDDYFASEAKLYRPTNCTVLAECCGVLNQPELGLSMIEQAVSGILETDQRMTEPDTWRVKGDLVLRLGSKDGRSIGPASREEAEVCFRKAVETARAQGSKMLELRATVSLAQLLEHSTGKAEARDALAEIFGWFTEGLDTPDLQQARFMLERMSA